MMTDREIELSEELSRCGIIIDHNKIDGWYFYDNDGDGDNKFYSTVDGCAEAALEFFNTSGTDEDDNWDEDEDFYSFEEPEDSDWDDE